MDYYLYSHSNADGIFYIGKGCKDRFKYKCLSKRTTEWHEASKDGYTSKIEANGTEADILSLEKIVIKSLVEQGVNLVNKHHNPNWIMPDEWRQKNSDAQTGNTGSKNGFFGKTHSDKTRKKMSDIAKQRVGENNHMFGKRHSNETKQKISDSTNNAGENNPMFGKKNIGASKFWQHKRLEKANNYRRSL